MDLKLGEFVRFVEERREGYITKIFDDQMIGVTGDDDFEIPVPANKVTRVHGHTYKGIESQALQEKPVSAAEFKATGVFLAVAPDASKGSVAHFHLVNETSYQLLTTFSVKKDNAMKGIFAAIIAPSSASKVYSASLTELSNWPAFNIQSIYYSGMDAKHQEPLNSDLKFSAKHFSGAKKNHSLLTAPAWFTQLDKEELVIDAQKLKESFFKPAEEKKEIDKPSREVDLHIEKLRDDHQFLTKDEILKVQLQHFQKALDAAIVHKLASIIFIHGVGNGTLKYEIHKVVSKHQQVRTFLDAYKERYGYGATEVILK